MSQSRKQIEVGSSHSEAKGKIKVGDGAEHEVLKVESEPGRVGVAHPC